MEADNQQTEQELSEVLKSKLQELQALPLGEDEHQKAVTEVLPVVLPVLFTVYNLQDKRVYSLQDTKVALSLLINATGTENPRTTSVVLDAGLLTPLQHVLETPGDDRILELGLVVLQNVCEEDDVISQVIEAGIVDTLVKVLAQNSSAKIQNEVLGALINITATEEHRSPGVATPETVLQVAEVLGNSTDDDVSTSALTILYNLCSGDNSDTRISVVVEAGNGKCLNAVAQSLDKDLGMEAVQSALDILWNVTGSQNGYRSEVIAAETLKKIGIVLSKTPTLKIEYTALCIINNLFTSDHIHDVVTSGVMAYVISSVLMGKSDCTINKQWDEKVTQMCASLLKKIKEMSSLTAAKVIPCLIRDLEETDDPELVMGMMYVLWHLSMTGEDAISSLVEEGYIHQFVRVLEWLKPEDCHVIGLRPALVTMRDILKSSDEAKTQTVQLGAATRIMSLLGITDEHTILDCTLDILFELWPVMSASAIWSILPYRLPLLCTSANPRLLVCLLRCLRMVAQDDEFCRQAASNLSTLQLIAYLLAQNTNKDVLLSAVVFIEVLAEYSELRVRIIQAGLLPPLSCLLSTADPQLVEAALSVFALIVCGTIDVKEDVMSLGVLPVITSLLARWTLEDDTRVLCNCLEFVYNLCDDGPNSDRYRAEVFNTSALKSLVILLPSLSADQLVEITDIYRVLSRLSWGKKSNVHHLTAIAEPEILSCMAAHLLADLPNSVKMQILGVITGLAPHLKELLCSSDLLPALARLLEMYYQELHTDIQSQDSQSQDSTSPDSQSLDSKSPDSQSLDSKSPASKSLASKSPDSQSSDSRVDIETVKLALQSLGYFAFKNPLCVEKLLQHNVTPAVIALLSTKHCQPLHELALQYVAVFSEGGEAAVIAVIQHKTLGHFDNLMPKMMTKKQISSLKLVLLALQNVTAGPDECRSAVASSQILYDVIDVVGRFSKNVELVEISMNILRNMTLGDTEHKQAAKLAGTVTVAREVLDTHYNLEVRATAKDILQDLGKNQSVCVIL